MSSKIFKFKITILGDCSVGKSCILSRYVTNSFNEYQDTTIGAAYSNKKIELEDDYTIFLDIWDTAGQEKYHSLTPMYYRGSHGVILVLDITNKLSFNSCRSWLDELHNNISHNCIIILACNKYDMVQEREISEEEIEEFCKANSIAYYYTSAKTGYNIEELFVTLAKLIPKIKQSVLHNQQSSVNVNFTPNNTKKTCPCS